MFGWLMKWSIEEPEEPLEDLGHGFIAEGLSNGKWCLRIPESGSGLKRYFNFYKYPTWYSTESKYHAENFKQCIVPYYKLHLIYKDVKAAYGINE